MHPMGLGRICRHSVTSEVGLAGSTVACASTSGSPSAWAGWAVMTDPTPAAPTATTPEAKRIAIRRRIGTSPVEEAQIVPIAVLRYPMFDGGNTYSFPSAQVVGQIR